MRGEPKLDSFYGSASGTEVRFEHGQSPLKFVSVRSSALGVNALRFTSCAVAPQRSQEVAPEDVRPTRSLLSRVISVQILPAGLRVVLLPAFRGRTDRVRGAQAPRDPLCQRTLSACPPSVIENWRPNSNSHVAERKQPRRRWTTPA